MRTADFKDHSIFTGTQWRVTQGPVQLQTRHDGGNLVQEVSTRFTADAPTAVLTLKPDLLEVAPASIAKVFVRYRMDESWAGLAFEVVRGGVVYRTNVTSYSFDRVWVDQELRWPDPNDDPTERRAYLPLQEVGARVPQPIRLSRVRVTATRNTLLGAWMGKIARNYLQSFREVPYARYMMTSLSLGDLEYSAGGHVLHARGLRVCPAGVAGAGPVLWHPIGDDDDPRPGDDDPKLPCHQVLGLVQHA